jgi:hypothetical protein
MQLQLQMQMHIAGILSLKYTQYMYVSRGNRGGSPAIKLSIAHFTDAQGLRVVSPLVSPQVLFAHESLVATLKHARVTTGSWFSIPHDPDASSTHDD